MPELPEVEVVRRGLAPLLSGRRICRVFTSGLPLRQPLDCTRLSELAVGSSISTVARRAKYLLLHLDNTATIVIHLGMSGRLGLFAAGSARQRHDHLGLLLDDGRELRLNDARRFGSVQIFRKTELQDSPLFAHLGPEPFDDGFSAAHLARLAASRRQPVKNFLMDNRNVVGVGNIYASEILFAVGLAPQTPACRLALIKWQQVVEATRAVLSRAIACGGTTIADFVNASGESGYFQVELQVYGRAGQPCNRCSTGIVSTRMAGRTSYYCPRCQR